MGRLAVLAVVGVACGRNPSADTNADGSNIARADYIGPNACGECHSEQYAAWSKSLHRVMNARPEDDGAVIGDFGGATLAYAGGEARFTREGRTYYVTTARGAEIVRYRVTRTIGRRGLQEYVGIADGRTEEVRIPFGWWPRGGGWFPQPYFDPWLGEESAFDAYAEVEDPWAERCPWCHSTYPFVQRIARVSMPHGAGMGLERLFTSTAGSERLATAEQVTIGISCESCHLGGRVHAAAGERSGIHFVPQGAMRLPDTPALPDRFADERKDAYVVNAVCAQCHTGASPRLADGGAVRNSSEVLDLVASSCRGVKCTDCHDPHRADSRADDQRSIAACTRCHARFAGAEAARRHAGDGHDHATCLDCHMPRIVMGIDRFVRTHRISSPRDQRQYVEGATNACNLCHLDRTLQWTVDALRDNWRVGITPRGQLDVPAGKLWLDSPRSELRILVAHAYTHTSLAKAALLDLARGLADPLPYVRTWTKFAVEDILGRRLGLQELDPRAPADVRARQLEALKASLERAP
jgi:hypothetical protein